MAGVSHGRKSMVGFETREARVAERRQEDGPAIASRLLFGLDFVHGLASMASAYHRFATYMTGR